MNARDREKLYQPIRLQLLRYDERGTYGYIVKWGIAQVDMTRDAVVKFAVLKHSGGMDHIEGWTESNCLHATTKASVLDLATRAANAPRAIFLNFNAAPSHSRVVFR